MSAMLDGMLRALHDAERLAAIAENDAIAGIAAPPVEQDQDFFTRAVFPLGEAQRIEADRERNRRKAGGGDRREREEALYWQGRNVADFIGGRS